MNEILHKILGAVENVFFNRKEHKVGAKYAKVRTYISALCDLCVEPLRPLRLMDLGFFNSPNISCHSERIHMLIHIHLI